MKTEGHASSLMDIDEYILNKMLANQVQQYIKSMTHNDQTCFSSDSINVIQHTEIE